MILNDHPWLTIERKSDNLYYLSNPSSLMVVVDFNGLVDVLGEISNVLKSEIELLKVNEILEGVE